MISDFGKPFYLKFGRNSWIFPWQSWRPKTWDTATFFFNHYFEDKKLKENETQCGPIENLTAAKLLEYFEEKNNHIMKEKYLQF